MNNKNGLFIYRPLAPDSLLKIRSLQEEYSSLKTFQPVEDLHLTLLDGRILKNLSDNHRNLITDRGPVTAEDSYDMRITAANFFIRARKLSGFSIALSLKLEDGHFQDEHAIFRAAAKRRGKKIFEATPHVTIGHINPEFSLRSTLEPAESLVGERLAFAPMESSAGKVRSRVDLTRQNATDMVIDIPVKTVIPGSIPDNFLASLRRSLE